MNKTIKRIALLASSLGLFLALLACRWNIFVPPPTPTPQPVPGLEELHFEDTSTGERFLALNACIGSLIDDSWRSTSYELRGNFYTASWCRGPGAPKDCYPSFSSQYQRDQQVLGLETLFYPQDERQVFGLVFHSLRVPPADGWGASFYFSEQGRSVVAENWGLTFSQFSDSSAPPAATVTIGWDFSYTIEGPNRTVFDLPADLPLRQDLSIYLSGPEAMRDRALEKNGALAEKVAAALQAGEMQACDLGPYLGNGIPPVCTLRPMTAEEQAAELSRARAHFAAQEELLRENYEDMYSAWMLSFPFGDCWE